MSPNLLEVQGLKTYFPIKTGLLQRESGSVKAVDDLSFFVKKGETFGLVGESGCGKSTTGRSLLRLIEPTNGKVMFDGQDITSMSEKELRRIRKDMQIVFQDPFASLNPRHTVRKILEEPFIVHGIGSKEDRLDRVLKLMEHVGLNPSQLNRYPHQFSGGQRQRIVIARALALNPKLIVADEPVSALDVSIQSQILNLLKQLQRQFQLTFIFIAHDLSVVKHFCDRVAVMYLGRIVELAEKRELYSNPKHPYTQALLSAVPVPDPFVKSERIILEGDVPNPAKAPQGCAFHTRCPSASERCRTERPGLLQLSEQHQVACHLYS
ncbi:dipeptide ABC transporter ATP-binding protein [Paenibacillus filicis]|uniref:Dipeptide ABC transporter ATP-binding protein n=1 Tax=Paenibacillus gyeongsangnamensis TaxID=3388067 RepID=A0ABT4QBJ7_9BACL|nr:dipeptide ABC transporter ATP-binding protein [Paenibacillus filicis]MCZ8514263.1 dipeptide ABC transporter ATP-binding protein [Paenibacillus filicis]